MTIHVQPLWEERNRAAMRRMHKAGAIGRDKGIQWGAGNTRARGSDSRVLRSPLFNPTNAPAGARLVAFSELDAGQCQWGFDLETGTVFCGLPVDPGAKGSALFSRYCPCHGQAAKGRTVVR